MSPDNRLVEIIELDDHPYFVGCQFHPEFKSRPMAPHPLFAGFVSAAMRRRQESERGVKGTTGDGERADLSSAPN
jgi:CTP synthase